LTPLVGGGGVCDQVRRKVCGPRGWEREGWERK